MYVLSLVGVAVLDRQGTQFPLSLLYISVPFALLGAATWVSFKRGGPVSRIIALVLVVHLLGTTAWGFMSGFSSVVSRNEGLHQANAEFAEINSELVADADTESMTAAANRLTDRRRAAATRLQTSENPNAAAVGQALEVMEEIMKHSNTRLLAAGEAVHSDRFRDIRGLLTSGDFTWHSAAAHEYSEAVAESVVAFEKIPLAVERELKSSEMDPKAAQEFVRGMVAARGEGASLFQAHARVAAAYEDYFAFAKAHVGQIHVDRSGIRVDAGPTKDGYDRRVQTMVAAEEALTAKARAMLRGVAKR
jgi:hypothetical protein